MMVIEKDCKMAKTAKTNSVVIIAATSFADEKGILRYAGEKLEISKELLDKHNELAEKFDLPKHTVVEDAKETTPVEDVVSKTTKPQGNVKSDTADVVL